MPFLMHGEEVGPDIDIFDREAMFIERRLSKWVKEFPGLRMTMEHLSSKARRRVRQERRAAGRRHDHALSSQSHPHRLARRRHQADDVRDAGDQDRGRPRRVAQGGDLGRGLLFPRHRFGAASVRAQGRDQRRSGHLQRAGRARDLCQGVRGGRRARQARSVRLAQRTASITACRRTRTRSCWKRRRGRRRSRSRSPGPTSARCSIAAARPSSGRCRCAQEVKEAGRATTMSRLRRQESDRRR